MSISIQSEPWRGLPPSTAEAIEPSLSAVAGEILSTIAAEVPEYARPLEGSFGRGIQTGVTEALRQFVSLIRDPDAGRGAGRDVYVQLGRGESRQGRTLDSLQSAYRVGARVAWRRISAAATKAGMGSEQLSLLAESIFAYIDELSADSVEGYAQAQAEVEDARRRRRRELASLMMRQPPPAEADLRAAAQDAGWTLPRVVAPLACDESQAARLAWRLPSDSLPTILAGTGCVLLPDPDGPGRAEQLRRAAKGLRVAIGPAARVTELSRSWALARMALRAAEGGAIAAEGPLWAEDHLAELLLSENRELVDRIAARRLAPLAGLSAKSRSRMEETALEYVRHRGNAAAMARAMHVHPQTARYRVARLRELLGSQLDDPDARFELELALR